VGLSWRVGGKGIFGNDGTTKEIRELIARDRGQQAGNDTALNATESAAVLVAVATAQQLDSASERRLMRRLRKAARAQKRYRKADAHVDRFQVSSSARAHLYNEAAEIDRAEENAEKHIDHKTPFVSMAAVIVIELVLLIAEFIFYYSFLRRGLPADASVLERLFTAVLAILVPCAALIAARLFAGSIHKLQSGREGETSQTLGAKRSSWDYAGPAVAAALLAAVVIATYLLVLWRYSTAARASNGIGFNPPGDVMAVIFVSLILADTATRTVLMHPAKYTSIRRRWNGRRVRTTDRWLLHRESSTLTKWIERDLSLRLFVGRLKNDRDQALATASAAIQIERGTNMMAGLQPSTKFGTTISEPNRGEHSGPAGSTVPVDGGLNGHAEADRNGATPIYSPSAQIDDDLAGWRFRHNVLDQAIIYLVKNIPPTHPRQHTKSGHTDLLRMPDTEHLADDRAWSKSKHHRSAADRNGTDEPVTSGSHDTDTAP
jgi:hypothetical protein